MIIFAHRGLPALYPENTMLSFKKAFDYKIDGIETDVQLTKDGVPVIFHDETLERCCLVKGYLKDLTYEELMKLDVCYMEGQKEKIPTLDELLFFLSKKDGLINLEIKSSLFEFPTIEEKTIELIKKYKLENRIIISSFNHETLLRFKKLAPELKLGALSGDRHVDFERYCYDNHFDYVHPIFTLATRKRCKIAHKLGLKVYGYTDDIKLFNPLLKFRGIDGVFTNCCHKFCKKRGE